MGFWIRNSRTNGLELIVECDHGIPRELDTDKGTGSMESGSVKPKLPQLILASASPRRQELLALTGWSSEILPTEVDETPSIGEKPLEYVTRLAEEKARAASTHLTGFHWLIAADTIVVDDDRILGKPTSPEDAKRILMDLRGREHCVITALAIVDPSNGNVHSDRCETLVPMRRYSPLEIDEYISGGSPLDKAGAYGIQDEDFRPVDTDRMRGCFANVMGLPLCHLTRSLKFNGIEPKVDVPAACQEFTRFRCEVYPEILRDQQ